eukprot:tig00020961_g16749.t1
MSGEAQEERREERGSDEVEEPALPPDPHPTRAEAEQPAPPPDAHREESVHRSDGDDRGARPDARHDDYADSDDDRGEIRTLFVSGLPADVTDREVFNAFRFAPGYESSYTKISGRFPVAFVTFYSRGAALDAMEKMQGVVFDVDLNMRIRIEEAKKNSRVKRRRDFESDRPPEKRSRDVGYPPSASVGVVGGGDKGPVAVSPAAAALAQMPGAGPTLFIANLGQTCTESELRTALNNFPGFQRLRLNNENPQVLPVAFAGFVSTEAAAEAMRGLQGVMLPSSERGGLRIEFARNPMGTPSQRNLERWGGR